MNPHPDSPAPLRAWIAIRRGEGASKCTIRPLRGTPGLAFIRYPLSAPHDFPNAILLAPGAPPLTAADASRPLLLLDASWRHARTMARAFPGLETRSIPPGWRTAYPRHSKVSDDPADGLATVEALHAALALTGRRDDSLLAHYRWASDYLRLNAPLLAACPGGPGRCLPTSGGVEGKAAAGEPRSRGFRKLADFFLLSFGYVGLRFLIAPIRSRLLTEQLGKPHYGALTLAVSTVTFLAMLLAVGSYEFLARRLPGLPVPRQKGWLSLVLRRLALPGWLLSGAVAGGLWATGWFPSWHGAYVFMLWLDLGLMLWLLERIYHAMGGNRIGTMRAIQLFQNDVWFLVVFALGAWAAASFAHTLLIWTLWLGLVALAVRLSDRQPGPVEEPQGAGMAEVLSFGLPLMPMVLGEVLFRIGDRYLLLWFSDLATVAEYMLAINIAMMGYVTGSSLLELSLPHLYAAANRHDGREGAAPAAGTGFWGGGMRPTDEMQRIFSLMLRHVMGLGGVMGLGFAFFRRDIFAVIAGPEFRNAASLMPWIAGIPLAFLLVMAASRALLVQKRTRIVGFATLAAALGNLAVDLVAVPLWGTHGAAMATLGSLLALAAFLCAAIDVRRWIDRESWKPLHLLFGIAGCAAADWGIVALLPDAAWWVRLPLAAVPAVLTGWLARIFTPADMALLKAANRSRET